MSWKDLPIRFVLKRFVHNICLEKICLCVAVKCVAKIESKKKHNTKKKNAWELQKNTLQIQRQKNALQIQGKKNSLQIQRKKSTIQIQSKSNTIPFNIDASPFLSKLNETRLSWQFCDSSCTKPNTRYSHYLSTNSFPSHDAQSSNFDTILSR